MLYIFFFFFFFFFSYTDLFDTSSLLVFLQRSMIEGRFVNDQAMNQSMSKKRGGWLSAILLLLNQGLATIGFVGVEVNLVLFCTRVLRQTNAEAANSFSRWMGTVHLFSLAGAFLSDAYLGRYYTCALFQPVLVIGLVALSLTTSFLLLKPHGCGTIDFLCHQPSTFQSAMFYLSIYLIALGSGAYEPSLATFGSDQFDGDHGDDENPNASSKQQSFYSYFYVATNLGSLVSETIIAYVQNTGRWTLGFYISTACALLAVALFFLGRTRYRFLQPSGPNPLSSFCQVVVASCNKAKIELPVESGLLYDGPEGREKTRSTAALPVKDFRFLDHAAIVTEEDAVAPNPWRLCTVAQVEDVKCVLRVLPIWLCTLTFAGVFVQMVSLFVEQGAAMDTALPGGFHIPPASLTAFDIVVVAFFIVSYDKLSGMLDKVNTPVVFPPNFDLWKMGAGLVVAMAGMVVAGILERERRDRGEGHQQSSLFILWQVPQYVLIGIGEALVYVGQYDFFSSQVPEALKSVGIGLSMAAVAVGSYVCSLVLTVVMSVTTRGGRVGWVPPDLNQGRLDAFFFLMAGITAVELAIYTWVARRYKYRVASD